MLVVHNNVIDVVIISCIHYTTCSEQVTAVEWGQIQVKTSHKEAFNKSLDNNTTKTLYVECKKLPFTPLTPIYNSISYIILYFWMKKTSAIS